MNNEYITTVTPVRGIETIENILSIIDGRGYIAGSYAAFVASPKPILPNDIDIFAMSEDAAWSIVTDLKKVGLYLTNTSNVAYTLTPLNTKPLPVQVVKPHPDWRNFPDDIIESFDLTVSRALLLSPTEVAVDSDIVLNPGKGKIIRINDPLRTLKRVIKYQARGIVFPDWELMKLFSAWDAMTPEKKQAAIEAILPMAVDDEPHEDYEDYGYGWYEEDDWFEGE